MSWLTWPIAAAAAAVAIPALVILYFLKLKRRDLEVSTTLLWKKAIQDLQANAPFQRLRRNILLLLQLLILAALLLAIAQPQMLQQASPSAQTVILIDRSASMSATDELDGEDRVSRLQRAKLDAIAHVETMRSGGLLEGGGLFSTDDADEAMVIVFDRSAEVVQPFTSNKDLLRAAIRSVEPTEATSSITEAVRLASAYAGPRLIEDKGLVPGAALELWSDGDIADIGEVALHPDTEVTFHRVGDAGSTNLAITALQAERAYDSPDEVSVFVGLQSTASTRREVDVEFVVDGLVSSVRTVPVAGRDAQGEPGVGGVVFTLTQTGGALVSARLVLDEDDGDVLDADNVAWLAIPPARRLAVGLVTEGNLFLRQALGGLTLSRLDVMTPAEFESLRAGSGLAAFDVFVFDRWAPAPDETGVYPPGRFLFFGAVPSLGGLELTRREDAPVAAVVAWERDHPALRMVNLDGVRIGSMPEVTAGDAAQVLARSTEGPAIVETSVGATRTLSVVFEVARSNWPYDVGFLLFLATAVEYLGNDFTEVGGVSAHPGEVVRTRVPAGVERVELTGPDDVSMELAPDPGGEVVFGPIRSSGVYRLEWRGPAGSRDVEIDGRVVRLLTASMLDATESRVGVPEGLLLARGEVAGQDGVEEGGAGSSTLRLWPWLLLTTCAIMLVEWFVYNRKVHI
ncbi:MAG: VWA domain-containing protein [Planctomycetota bacterium]